MDTGILELDEVIAALADARSRLGSIEINRRLAALRDEWRQDEAEAIRAKAEARIEAARKLIESRLKAARAIVGALQDFTPLLREFDAATGQLLALNLSAQAAATLNSELPAQVRALDAQTFLAQVQASSAPLAAELCSK
jgi:hypothetical protein